jgi:formamidopyrimidine-DNA glycosylase
MIELPEARSLACQLTDAIAGKRIKSVTAGHTPHKLSWFYGDRSRFSEILEGMTIEGATSRGGLVEIRAEKTMVLFGDGVNIRFHDVGEPHPSRHQFLLEFEDRSALSAAVQMYGGVGAFIEGELSNPYYMVAREKPSPFSEEFDLEHFQKIVTAPEVRKSTMKMLLATEQRIPGLGNGVLQDILFNSRMHPRKKVNTLGEKDIERLFDALKGTLTAMAEQRGRDTEVDIYGRPGGYRTILSKNTLGKECPMCGTAIKKEIYLGGTVYYCEKCQQT